jgi:hypothetical protein
MGGGGKKDEDNSSSYNPNSYDATESNFGAAPDFAAQQRGGGGAGGSSLEQELMMEQQKMLVQAVMFKLTEAAFQKCVEKPSSSLSSSETSCIRAVTGKYLDTSEVILSRMSK